MKNILAIILFALVFAFSKIDEVSAQEVFINGGFEHKTDSSLPLNWNTPIGDLVLDSVIKFSGKYSGCLTVDTSRHAMPYGVIYTGVEVGLFTNKTIEMRAKVKYELKDTASSAKVFFQHFPKLDIVCYGEEQKGCSDWIELITSIDIDSVAPIAIFLGCEIQGEGTVWLDDVELYVDGELISYNPRTKPLTDTEKDWLNENTFELKSKELYSSIKNARILGIGEETHASASILNARWDMVKDLIINKDFTIIAAEMYQYIDLNNVNDFVTLETDSLPSIRHRDYDFLLWLREFNKTSKTKVQFIGVEAVPQALIPVINKKSKGALKLECDTLEDIFFPAIAELQKGPDREWKTIKFTPAEQKTLVEIIDRCMSWGDKNIQDKEQKLNFANIVDLLKENIDISYTKRDELMAQVIEYLAKQNPNDKIIFIAHNGHVQFGLNNWMSKQAGSYLHDKFGKEYYNIRMTFYDGEYRATEKASLDNPRPRFATFSHIAMPGSSEYLFNHINKTPFFLPLRDLKPISGKNDWIFKSLEHLGIGAGYKDYCYNTFKLRDGFDAVIFIKTSKAY